jgi:hypothetical protein
LQSFSKQKKHIKQNKMANCHQLFQDYNEAIKLSDKDRRELENKRRNLISKIQNGFQGLGRSDLSIEFHTQGSFIMDTIIDPDKKDYDLDEGIYFIGKNTIDKISNTPADFHQFVIDSISDFTDEGEIEKKDTCVRVKYKPSAYFTKGFHIDLPIYYGISISDPHLANKKDGWVKSNPIDFIDWFENTMIKSDFQKAFIYENLEEKYMSWTGTIRKNDHQLRKIVRYLKGWGDYQFRHGEKNIPAGIVLSILSANNFKLNENRDDVALLNVLQGIDSYFEKEGVKCIRPTTKVEDIMKGDLDEKKKHFKAEIKKFIISAQQAINNPNHKEACLKWQNHFGPRFSCAFAIDTPEDAESQPNKAFLGASHKSA